MATDLAKLVVQLEAQTAKYSADLDKAKRKLGMFERSTKQTLRDIGKAFAQFAAASGVALTAFAKSALDNADELSKMSQKVGISTEALSQLDYAAKISGASIEELRKGFVRLSKNALDASAGLAAPKRAFDALGISVKKADGNFKGTEELLLEIADAYAGLEDGAGKAAISQDLFGRAGAQLIPLLNQGRDGIEKLKKEADALGLTLSTSAGLAAEEFNDNIERLTSVLKGAFNQALQQVLPVMESFSVRAVDAATSSGKMSQAAQVMATGFRILISAAIVLAESFRLVGEGIGAAAAAFAAVIQGDFRRALDILTTNAQDGIDQVKQSWEDLKLTWSDGAGQMATATEQSGERIRKSLQYTTDATAAANEELERQTALLKMQGASRYAGGGGALPTNAPLDPTADIRGMGDPYGISVKVEEIKDKLQEVNEFGLEAARNMQSAFADFLFDPFKDGLDGMLRGFADTIRRMVAEIASQQLLTSFFGALAGSGNSFLSGIGSFFGGGKAMGGPVSSSKAYIVGERGPGLLMGASGRIVPGTDIGGGGGLVVSPVYNIDARGATQELAKQLPAILAAHARQTVDMARRAINDDFSRGAFGRA